MRCKKDSVVAAGLWLVLVVTLVAAALAPNSGSLWQRGANAGTLATLYATALTVGIFLWTRKRNAETTDLVAAAKAAATAAHESSKAACKAAENAEVAAAGAAARIQDLAKALANVPAGDLVPADDLAQEPGSLDESLEPPAGECARAQAEVGGTVLSLFAREVVPLRVVAALVGQWEQDHLTGKYRVQDIDAVARVTGRKGNFPWFVHFAGEPADTWWKVSFGGKGKSGGTVTKVKLKAAEDSNPGGS